MDAEQVIQEVTRLLTGGRTTLRIKDVGPASGVFSEGETDAKQVLKSIYEPGANPALRVVFV